jgi:hypothetical protein
MSLQLWLRALPPAAELPALSSAAPAEPRHDDALLGCAAVDLSALAVMGGLDGWYNLVDHDRQPRGQIKVEVRAGAGFVTGRQACAWT